MQSNAVKYTYASEFEGNEWHKYYNFKSFWIYKIVSKLCDKIYVFLWMMCQIVGESF